MDAEIVLPGSKSITLRALVLAALSLQPVLLENFLEAQDTEAMIHGLSAMGFDLAWDKGLRQVYFSGKKESPRIQPIVIQVRDSGITARFLPVVASLFPGQYRFEGSERMELRPVGGLLQVLQGQGNEIHYLKKKGAYPFSLKANGLKGGPIKVGTNETTQFLSSFLIAGAYAKSPLMIAVDPMTFSEPFVEMTLQMIKDWGGEVVAENNLYTVRASPYQLKNEFQYRIEPDATAASYFAAFVALHGGQLRLLGANKWRLQGDRFFLKLLEVNGLKVFEKGDDLVLSSVGWVEDLEVLELNFSQISDTFLTYAALAPLLGKPIRLTGLKHTCHQESDRLLAVAEALTSMGQGVEVFDDGIAIQPAPLRPAAIDPHGDHRVAMAFGVLGTYDLLGNGEPWLTVLHPAVCDKTFPDFWHLLRRIS